MNNKYDVGVWKLSYYKIDTETGDALCDDKGDVIEFYVPNEDCSQIAESVNINDLMEGG